MHKTGRRLLRGASIRSTVLLALFVLVASHAAVHYFGPIRDAARWIDDFRLAYSTPLRPQNNDVVILAIDEQTLAQMQYRSPIDREFIAGIIERVDRDYEPRAIGVDLIIDQPTDPAKDRRLQAALDTVTTPLVFATGDAAAGLSARQLEYQDAFLEGVRTGSSVLETENGVVRTFQPVGDDGEPSFAAALAGLAGLPVTAAPQAIVYRRGALDNPNPVPVYPASSVGRLPRQWLEDRIVLIGAEVSDRDRHRTPLSMLGGRHDSMAGVMIHAQTLAQLATGASLPGISAGAEFAVLFLATVLGLALAFAPIAPLLRIMVGSSAFVSYWLLALSPTIYGKVALPLILPSFAFLLAVTLATAVARQRERRQKNFLHSAFNQYVSTEIIDDLIDNPSHLQLGGERREMSFIFTDIAGFSTLTESITPEELIELLEGYLDGVVEIALKHRGTIARFVGDGVLIFFGAPVPDEEHRRHAVECALALDEFCEAYRRSDKASHTGFGVTRIGVHSGPAIVGNVGGRRRFEYTAHGDTVNSAARIESANRHFGTRVCLSEAAVAGCPELEFRPVGRVFLKGKCEPIQLYTTWSGVDDGEREAICEAFVMMEETDGACVEHWEALARRRPGDALVAFHVERLRSGETRAIFRLADK